MKNSNFKVLIMPAIILFAVCLVSTFLLAYTNKITEPRIEDLLAANAQAARKDLLPDAVSFNPGTAELNGEAFEYYEGLDAGGKTAGYVFTTVSTGYGGDIKVMTGVDADGAVIKISILELSETPGLGMNATDDSFINLFTGKSGSISVVKNNPDEKQIKAMTGATITSSAVTAAVNSALKLYDAVIAKGVPGTTDSSAADADEAARKQLLPQAASFDPPVKAPGSDYEYYTGKNADGSVAGYIFTTQDTGYISTVLVSTAVDSMGVIKGVKVLSTNDTPGLGTNVQNDSFLAQYIGLSEKVLVTTGTAGKNQVQAVTGATISSSGVTNAVNKALELYKSIAGGTP